MKPKSKGKTKKTAASIKKRGKGKKEKTTWSKGPFKRDDSQNIKVWETSFDTDLFLRLHLWTQNERHYFNIRRGEDSNGVNIGVEALTKLQTALEKMIKKNSSFFSLLLKK